MVSLTTALKHIQHCCKDINNNKLMQIKTAHSKKNDPSHKAQVAQIIEKLNMKRLI